MNHDIKTCEDRYVGNTLQRLHDRIYQHKYAVSRCEVEKSAIAQHVFDNSTHVINWQSVDILDKEVDRKKRFFKELVYIGKEVHRMNRNDDLRDFPKSYLPLLDFL